MLGREFRQVLDVPLVMTYHTKFDVDIANLIHSKVLQESSKRALVENINACNEVWAVSRGAAENLRSLGWTSAFSQARRRTGKSSGPGIVGQIFSCSPPPSIPTVW